MDDDFASYGWIAWFAYSPACPWQRVAGAATRADALALLRDHLAGRGHFSRARGKVLPSGRHPDDAPVKLVEKVAGFLSTGNPA